MLKVTLFYEYHSFCCKLFIMSGFYFNFSPLKWVGRII